jgi:hypothetical protein
MMRAGRPTADEENIERDVTARVDRQEIFASESPPTDESLGTIARRIKPSYSLDQEQTI